MIFYWTSRFTSLSTSDIEECEMAFFSSSSFSNWSSGYDPSLLKSLLKDFMTMGISIRCWLSFREDLLSLMLFSLNVRNSWHSVLSKFYGKASWVFTILCYLIYKMASSEMKEIFFREPIDFTMASNIYKWLTILSAIFFSLPSSHCYSSKLTFPPANFSRLFFRTL